MKSKILFASAACAMLLTGCFEENTTTVNEAEGLDIVAKGDTLPECVESIQGKMVYVADSSSIFVCADSSWNKLNGENGKNGQDGADGQDGSNGKNGSDGLNGLSGFDGESCTAKSVDEGIEISCGGEVVDTVFNGQNGTDGESCTAKSVDEGVEISCGGIFVFTVLNGQNGIDGESCTAKSVDEGVEISCGGIVVDTVFNGQNGADGDSCTAKSVDEGIEVSCGGIVVDTVVNGQKGNDGKSCTAKSVDEGVEISCDGVVVDTVVNGKNRTDGESCFVSEFTDSLTGNIGYKLTCGGVLKGVVWNAKNGSDGKGCSMTDNGDGTVSLTCGKETATIYKAVCGTTAYDPAVSFCLDGTLYSCGNEPYNPNSQICNNDSIYDFCGGKSFDPAVEFCWSQKLYQLCDGKSYDVANEYCLILTDYTKVEALLTDSRDNQVYKTVTIGSQVWMAQNLNYAYTESTKDLDSNSFCYNNEPDSCAKYGRLYTWAAAIDSVALANDAENPLTCVYNDKSNCLGSLPNPIQGVCPEGWHLPSYDEWDALIYPTSGSMLKPAALKSTSGWAYYFGKYTGLDAFGFTALPAGVSYALTSAQVAESSKSVGQSTYFWSSTEIDSHGAYSVQIVYSDEYIRSLNTNKYLGASIRCLKNAE